MVFESHVFLATLIPCPQSFPLCQSWLIAQALQDDGWKWLYVRVPHVAHDAVLTYTQRNHATDLEPCTSHTTLIPTWLATLDMMAKGSHVGPEILMGLALRWNFFSMYSQFMFDFTNGCFTGLQELSDLHDVSWSLVVQSNEKKKPLQIDSFKWCYDISEIVDPNVHVKVGHCFTVGVVMVLT